MRNVAREIRLLSGWFTVADLLPSGIAVAYLRKVCETLRRAGQLDCRINPAYREQDNVHFGELLDGHQYRVSNPRLKSRLEGHRLSKDESVAD